MSPRVSVPVPAPGQVIVVMARSDLVAWMTVEAFYLGAGRTLEGRALVLDNVLTELDRALNTAPEATPDG